MKKYKILIVHNYYKVPGGEDTVVENEKKMLLENGHDVEMYIRHNDEINYNNKLINLRLLFNSIFSVKTYKEIKKIIKDKNIDIVHVHNTLPLISPSVYYSAKACKIPVVQTIHNFRLLCPGATFTRNNKICEKCVSGGLMNSIKYKCYRNSRIQTIVSASILKIHRVLGIYDKIDGYIALTNFNKKKLSSLVDSNKIFVKPNFVSINNNSNNVYKREYFLYLGRLDKIKGVDLILKAWKQLNGIKLLIVGKGPDEDFLKEYVRLNNISNVEFLGFKEKKDVKELIAKAKALIIASQWYEGFPMTIIESFSMGTPVIAGKIGNMSNIIEEYNNGLFFEYNNYDSLIKKVNEVNNNEKLMKKLEIGARNSYDLKYTEIINYKILMQIYSDVGVDNDKM